MNKSQKITLLHIVASLVLLLIAHFLPLPQPWKLITYLLPYLLVGAEVMLDALKNILHFELLDEAFLMTAATIGAFALGEYDEAVAVMLFFQLGELFQSLAVGKSERNLSALLDLRPDTACVLRCGVYQEVPPQQVQIGETIKLCPGEKVPLDGIIVSGNTTVNTMALTGESLPRELMPGDQLLSGSVNLTGLITVKVTARYAEGTVAKILKMVEDAAERKSHAEQFVTKFAKIYTPCVVIAAALLAVLPSLVFGNRAEWIRRALIFLVVSCPCALVVSVPLTFFCSIGCASGKGILIKGAEYLERLAGLSSVLFDKTGTLTSGRFSVRKVCPNGCSEQQLLRIAAYAEANSDHPIAASVVQAYNEEINRLEIASVTELPGCGIIADIGGRRYAVGNRKLLEKVGADCPETAENDTVVHVADGQTFLGYLTVGDTVKPDAKEALAQLDALGIKETVMLTGDHASAAKQIADDLGIRTVHAALLPDDKVRIAEAYLKDKKTVAFIGDGINDAPALMRADLGIAMGAYGTDAAMEAADIVFMDDSLRKLPTAVKIGRKSMRIVKQNIILALSVKFAVLFFSALGLTGSLGIWIAVFADVGVTLLAVCNALRAFRVKP